MAERKWHLEHADGSRYTDDELVSALPYESAMYVIDMSGNLFFACIHEIDAPKNTDMVVVND